MVKDSCDTFPKLFVRNCQEWPDFVAMRKKHFGIWKEYRWKECFSQVKFFSLGIIELGLEAGDRVAIVGENEPEWFWTEFAVQAARGIVVGVYVDMDFSEIKHIAGHCQCKFAVVTGQEPVDKFLKIKKELPGLKKVIYWNPKGLRNYRDPLLINFDDVLELGKHYESAHPKAFDENVGRGTGEDIAAIYHTSGTDGLPKAGMISYRALINSGKAFLEYNPATNKDNLLSYIPAAWIGQGIFATAAHLLNGVVLNFAEEPETTEEDLREIAPHIVLSGPRQWEDLARTIQIRMQEAGAINRLLYRTFLKLGYKRLQLIERSSRRNPFWICFIALADFLVFSPLRENFGMNQCRIAATTGSTISIDAFRFLSELGIPLKQLYGSTEAGFVAGHRSDEIRCETLGSLSNVTKLKISEEEEILVKGPTTFSGYYNEPERNERLDNDGWVHTGDAGHLDRQGHLVFIDRLSDISHLANAAKYAPQDLEGRLRFSPYIKHAMVLGGEKRDSLSVIIVIDFESVGKRAEDYRIHYTTFSDLSQKEEVAHLIRAEIDRLNKSLTDQVKLKKFAILPKEFDADEAEITRTGKLRRRFVENRYSQLINAMYGRDSEVQIEAFVRYRDGRKGVVKTNVKIWLAEEAA